MSDPFDPVAREHALRAEAEQWDTSQPIAAAPEDIPVIDVGPWFTHGQQADLDAAASRLRLAAEEVGFHQLVGHGIERDRIDRIFAATHAFHALPSATKETIAMDRPGWPLGGVGYLRLGERKLPRRAQGNANEAFLLKSDMGVDLDDNQWLAESDLPGFRAEVAAYADAISELAMRLLPLYAVALELPPDHFDEAFHDPFWRLRLTHYPPAEARVDDDDAYGIAPHVDTTFFTLLLQDGPGLTIYSAARSRWITVPVVADAFVVNSGELLRQWSNDRFLSTRHFADNPGPGSRYSIPFFFNANADHVMETFPTCHGPDNPPRYAPVSYRQSQAAVQGE